MFDADRVTCGDWVIPFANVGSATLYKASQLFIPVSVLELTTDEETFQFGLNPWVDVLPHLPLEVTVRQARLGSSPFSKMARVALALLVLWLVWDYLQ